MADAAAAAAAAAASLSSIAQGDAHLWLVSGCPLWGRERRTSLPPGATLSDPYIQSIEWRL